jgi:hypothetical protein
MQCLEVDRCRWEEADTGEVFEALSIDSKVEKDVHSRERIGGGIVAQAQAPTCG